MSLDDENRPPTIGAATVLEIDAATPPIRKLVAQSEFPVEAILLRRYGPRCAIMDLGIDDIVCM
jgi:hypothetical protein